MIKKKIFKQCLAGILSLAMTVTLFPTGTLGTVQAADVQAPQPVLHYDMSHADGKLTDVSGNAHDGKLSGFTDADFVTDDDGDVLKFDGSAKYVEIPSSVIKGGGKEAFTIEATFTDNVQSAAWLFTLGTTVDEWPNVKNYLFVAPCSGDYSGKMLAAIKNDSDELRYDSETAIACEKEGKNIVTVVFDNGDVTYYMNGLKSKTTESGYKIQDILSANSTASSIGYIGKSLYRPDPYFKGTLSDFKVYEAALTEEQVGKNHQEIAEPLEAPALEKVNAVKEKILPAMLNENADKDHIVYDLSFPAEIDGVTLKWTSLTQDVISDKGKITPKDAEAAAQIKVEASYNRRGVQTQTYDVKVLGKSDVEYDSLTIPNMNDIRGNITLPTKGAAGSAITWKSDNEAVISTAAQGEKPAGVVNRQDADTPVKLTATIKTAGGDRTKEFNVTVKKKASVGAMTDYMFAYFIGNGAGEEQIYFAASRDGLDWEELNDGKPVLESDMGTTGLRDPFILRSPEGDKFYLIATDLCIAKNGNWGDAQTKGSQAIMVWESTDLVNWTKQRMMTISAGIEAGCTWAPEIFYDETTGEYMVFWASKVKTDNYGKQRLYYCKTRDFYTFTEPKVWIDESHSAIDSTVVRDVDGTYYRFTKNESKTYIYMEKSDSLLGEWTMVNSNIASGVEGPCCFAFNEDDIEKAGAKWCLLQDAFGAGGYYPMITDDLSGGKFTKISANLPARPRHGTVMNITAEEYKALTSKWGKPSLAANSLPTVVETGYTLPAEADVVYAGETKKVPVTWDKTADDFKEPGTVTVTGTFTVDGKEGSSTKTIEVITVSEDWIYYIDSGVGSWNSNLSQSAYFELAAKKADLRNIVPDQIYAEGSWGINNPKDSSKEGYANAGNRTSAENSIYANGWWAKDGKACDYIIPLENGTYEATGYFAEWWSTTRPIKFYAQYTDGSGQAVKSDDVSISLSGSNKKQNGTVTITVSGVTGKAEVHFYAENANGVSSTPAPVIAGLVIEKKMTDDEKADLETKKAAAKTSLEQVTAAPAGDSKTEMFIGGAQDITVTYPADLEEKAKAANMEVVTTFVSGNPAVANVDAKGKITAVAAGEVEITTTVALSSKISKSFITKVLVKEVPVDSIELNKNALTLNVGAQETLTADVLPANATNKVVTWASDNPQVASVDNGKVTAVAAGNAKITATAGDKTATCEVVVKNPNTVVAVTGVTLTPKKSALTLALGKKTTFGATVAPANATNKKVTWSTSNSKIAAISKPDKNGKITVTAKKAGTATIKVTTANGKTASCKITVVSINKTKLELGKGEKFSLKVSGTKKKVTWSTSNKKAVTVKNGNITAKKTGKKAVTITAKVDGATLSCKVTVKNAPKKISLNKKSKILKKGKTFQIKVKFPKNTTSNKLTYKSSKSKVAKVDANGKVKALKKGKATITVTTFNKKKAKITITVK